VTALNDDFLINWIVLFCNAIKNRGRESYSPPPVQFGSYIYLSRFSFFSDTYFSPAPNPIPDASANDPYRAENTQPDKDVNQNMEKCSQS
jgi:hypothetical protein